ncbi:hypothetical protein D3C75_627240 [compost metagenome]
MSKAMFDRSFMMDINEIEGNVLSEQIDSILTAAKLLNLNMQLSVGLAEYRLLIMNKTLVKNILEISIKKDVFEDYFESLEVRLYSSITLNQIYSECASKKISTIDRPDLSFDEIFKLTNEWLCLI